jgi:hypothetical protein
MYTSAWFIIYGSVFASKNDARPGPFEIVGSFDSRLKSSPFFRVIRISKGGMNKEERRDTSQSATWIALFPKHILQHKGLGEIIVYDSAKIKYKVALNFSSW